MKTKSIKAIDLFCGAGGSSWGASKAGVQVVAVFDLWDKAIDNLKLNLPHIKTYIGRIEDADISNLRKELGNIDLIMASPECTNHSPAKGNKPKCDTSRNTAFQVTRFAEIFRPRWIIIENVVSMKRWSRYGEFITGLKGIGYKIREQMLDSSNFGVPQKRRRLFILCDLVKEPKKIRKGRGRKKNARIFIDLDGKYNWSLLRIKNRAKATLTRARKGIKTLGAKRPFLIVYYGSDHAGGWQSLNRPLRTITTIDRFAIVKPSKNGHLMRMLQVPELQSAMGMEGMTIKHGTRRERIKMIGNAVCPPVMCEIIKQISAD